MYFYNFCKNLVVFLSYECAQQKYTIILLICFMKKFIVLSNTIVSILLVLSRLISGTELNNHSSALKLNIVVRVSIT